MTYFLQEHSSMSDVFRDYVEDLTDINCIPEGMNYQMLADKTRLDHIIKPGIDQVPQGSVFLDLGCGTGLIGFYALKKGAKFVYFVERDAQMYYILEKILPKKLDPSMYKLIHKDIQSLTIEDFNHGSPDVATSEFYGPLLFDEGYMAYSAHIKSLFPNCKFIPEVFTAEIELCDVDFNIPPWPIEEPEVLDHFKIMYEVKGYNANNMGIHKIDVKNPKLVDKIIFNADEQTINNKIEIHIPEGQEKMIHCTYHVKHGDIDFYWKYVGWYHSSKEQDTNYKFYIDELKGYQPKLIKI